MHLGRDAHRRGVATSLDAPGACFLDAWWGSKKRRDDAGPTATTPGASRRRTGVPARLWGFWGRARARIGEKLGGRARGSSRRGLCESRPSHGLLKISAQSGDLPRGAQHKPAVKPGFSAARGWGCNALTTGPGLAGPMIPQRMEAGGYYPVICGMRDVAASEAHWRIVVENSTELRIAAYQKSCRASGEGAATRHSPTRYLVLARDKSTQAKWHTWHATKASLKALGSRHSIPLSHRAYSTARDTDSECTALAAGMATGAPARSILFAGHKKTGWWAGKVRAGTCAC